MTFEQALEFYIEHMDKDYGNLFAASVGRFQEGFLSDSVTDDVDEAFRRGVEAASKFIDLFKIRAAA